MDRDSLGSARHQLAKLARRRKCRVLGWPRDWRPGSVLDPKTGKPFTEAAAWEFIAEVLETTDVALEAVEMREPGSGGKTGYVLLVPTGERRLYIKLQLGAGRIIGRSFHYSEFSSFE